MAINIKREFVERVNAQIADAQLFYKSLEESTPVSIRFNQAKLKWANELPLGDPIPWNPNGVYLPERPSYIRDASYHAGLYYPMEASSMALDHVLKVCAIDRDSILLDLCAAPGGKSLILKDHFPDQLLVSNDIDRQRASVIVENSIKWGAKRHIITSADAAAFLSTKLSFGIVLVDAPCSDEGLFRKDERSRSEWTLERARGCAVRQEDILDEAFQLVAEEGYLIYSTFTFNPQENMQQVTRLCKKYGFKSLGTGLETFDGVEVLEEAREIGYQFWPHRIKGEGFFIALLQKGAGPMPSRTSYVDPEDKSGDVAVFDWLKLPKEDLIRGNQQVHYLERGAENVLDSLKGKVRTLRTASAIAYEKGHTMIPSYELANTEWARNNPHKYELKAKEVLKYLRGEALNCKLERGVHSIYANGLTLGFGKSIVNRVNNLYPKHLRLRS